MPANPGSRYNKRVSRNDIESLDPTSPEYWEEVLKREGLGLQRGKTSKLVYGWEPYDTDDKNADDYSEEAEP